MKKIINFLGRGTALPQTPAPRRLRRLDSRVIGARPATPQCSSCVDAHAESMVTVRSLLFGHNLA